VTTSRRLVDDAQRMDVGVNDGYAKVDGLLAGSV
jgi:hypothetical protein